MNQNTIKCRSAPRPAQDSLLSWFFQWWLNAHIFYRYEVLTSSIRVAINDFYHVIKPEITQMAMTFLYLQYTRGPDAAIWRSWSKTNLLIERPGINWRCPYILLSSATFFPYFFFPELLFRTNHDSLFYWLAITTWLMCSYWNSTVLWAEHLTASQETWFLSYSVCFVFAGHSISSDLCSGPSHQVYQDHFTKAKSHS